MRGYLTGIGALLTAITLFSFTEAKENKTARAPLAEHYFRWDASQNMYQEVDSPDQLDDCTGGPSNCGAISSAVDANGQPSGTVNYLKKP